MVGVFKYNLTYNYRFLLRLATMLLLVLSQSACAENHKAAAEAQSPAEYEAVWVKVRDADRPTIAAGWGQPVRLDVSGGYWGDDLWVDSQGKSVYFTVYEGDAMTDMMINHKPTSHPEIYVSDYPFATKRKVGVHNLSHPVWGNAGLMIDANGDFWYMSNRKWAENGKPDTDIYKNDDRLPFSTDESENNPHYCVATDELWFDIDDRQIMVLEHAKQDGFAGKPHLAPKPINSFQDGVRESQPWLSMDGKRMLFSSTRGHRGGSYIYSSTRLADNNWSEPVPVIYNVKNGVGEPSMPADESKLFYEQILRNESGGFTTEFFYIEKLASGVEPILLSDFVGLGSTMSAKVDPASSLAWEYHFKGDPFAMLIDQKVFGKETYKGISLKLRSDNDTVLSLMLSEKGGVRYNHLIELTAGETKMLLIPLSEFTNQPDSPNPNGKIDLNKIESLALFDAKNVIKGNASGDNILHIDSIGWMK
jgi:WD40-like Beta Propeller Repeat